MVYKSRASFNLKRIGTQGVSASQVRHAAWRRQRLSSLLLPGQRPDVGEAEGECSQGQLRELSNWR
jgi:hypothetical protein